MADPNLRSEVETAVLVELERVGPEAFRRDPIVQAFLGRGSSKPTLYRWIDHLMKSGRTGAHMAETVKAAVAERSKRTPEPAKEAASEIIAALPAIVRPIDIAGQGGTISVILQLQQCLEVAQQIIKQSVNPDGSVRLTKTALAASEHIRRCLETSVRIASAMREISRIDEFHVAMVEEVGKESPEVAERLRQRLHHMTATWERC